MDEICHDGVKPSRLGGGRLSLPFNWLRFLRLDPRPLRLVLLEWLHEVGHGNEATSGLRDGAERLGRDLALPPDQAGKVHLADVSAPSQRSPGLPRDLLQVCFERVCHAEQHNTQRYAVKTVLQLPAIGPNVTQWVRVRA